MTNKNRIKKINFICFCDLLNCNFTLAFCLDHLLELVTHTYDLAIWTQTRFVCFNLTVFAELFDFNQLFIDVEIHKQFMVN